MDRLLCHFVLCLSIAVTADKPQFPDWPLPPIPDKKVDPPPTFDPINKLAKGQLYVVLHNGEETQLLCSPSGVVSIKEFKNSVVIDGNFVDGGEATREYTAKQVFLVKRLQPGSFELLKVPAGKVERRQLADVVPDPMPPDPTPPGPTPVPAKTFRIIFAVESGDTMTPAQVGIIYGPEVEKWCLANCTGGKDGFRRRDKDNPTVSGAELSAIWNAARPLIQKTPVAVVEKNTHIEIIPLEADSKAQIAVFNEYLTGKRGK